MYFSIFLAQILEQETRGSSKATVSTSFYRHARLIARSSFTQGHSNSLVSLYVTNSEPIAVKVVSFEGTAQFVMGEGRRGTRPPPRAQTRLKPRCWPLIVVADGISINDELINCSPICNPPLIPLLCVVCV